MTVSGGPITAWRVQEGAMVVGDGTPEEIAAKLKDMNVVAEIEWFPVTPHLVGLNVLVNKSGGVAALDNEESVYRVGVTSEELASALAKAFEAEVTVGEHKFNCLENPGALPPLPYSDDDDARVCEVSTIAESAIPFCAASEGKDMGSLDLDNGLKAVFYATTDGEVREGTMATMQAPCVALYVKPHNYSIAAVVTDENGAFPERLKLHSWTLRTEIITGSVDDPSQRLTERVRRDLGHGKVANHIADVFAEVNQEELLEATRTPGREGYMKAVKALGLPSDMAAFLFGRIPLESVPHARVYPAQGWTEALGTSMDIKLTEPEPAGSLFWKLYRKAAVEKPWIMRLVSFVEAVGGAALLTASIREKKPRSGWASLGGIVGIVMMVDSVFQVSLAQYLSGRAKKHRNRFVGDVKNDS